MRINELCESVDFELDKKEKDPNDPHGLGFDLKEDLMFFMNHDDDAYRRHTYPAVLKIKDMIESGKKPDYKLFDKAVKEAYNKYCNKFQIRELPHELEQKMLEEMCQSLYEEECEKIKNGHYEVK
jgi:hypothetical protein